MGMEVAGSELVHGNDEFRVKSFSNPHEKENGKIDSGKGITEPVKFGSHGVDETAKSNGDNVSSSNFSVDAADEWPAEQKIHSFYIVRFRSYDDPDLKAEIGQFDREIWKKNRLRVQILDRIKAKRLDRAHITEQLISLGQDHRQYRAVLDDKINLIRPLKDSLGSLRGPNNASRDKVTALCSFEEKLNQLTQRLNYRRQREVNSLPVEKQLMREIKQLEGTRAKVIANAAMRAKIQESLGQKEAMQDKVKLIGTNLDGVKKERVVKSKIKELEDELKAIDIDIVSLQLDLTSVLEKRDKAVETIHKLRKQRDDGNACFFQNRTLLNNVKELAAEKNLEALKELSCKEVEKFMASWNSSKSFRKDYEKRISASLDIRQLSEDGRMRNPDEKPLFLLQHTKQAEGQTSAETTPKPAKKNPKPAKEQETVAVENAEKESKRKQRGDPKTILKPRNAEEEDYYVVELPKKETVKHDVVDEAKLKEIRKQEEMEKQKQAMERKKKLAEKAAVKAALRAQKEAEKKLKEREKKMKKKESASAFPSNQDEATDTKFEKVEETVGNTKESKDVSTKVRYGGRTKDRDAAIAKAILKRKRSNKYLLWVASAAVVVAVILAILCN